MSTPPPIAATIVLAASTFLAAGAASATAGEISPPVTLAVGDVIDGRAVIVSAPGNGDATWTIEVATDPAFRNLVFESVVGSDDPLVPAKVVLEGLEPGGRHHVRLVVAGDVVRTATFVAGGSALGSTAAAPGVRFGVTGDWRGDVGIFNAILDADERDLDFFVKLGDTIYADVPSPAVPAPQATTLEEFRLKHIENYAPAHGIDPWGDLVSAMPIFAMIDDHEVVNDFDGGAFDPRDGWFNQSQLYVNGLQAFVEHNPILPAVWPDLGDDRTDGRPLLYRSFQWGPHAAVLMMDARSFRDANLPPVANPLDPAEVQAFVAASLDPSRTMLGAPQLGRLLADLQAAEEAGVTWKFVMTSMPMQNFGPIAAEDRWEGYAAERALILSQIAALGINNVVFVTADFHGTIVNDLTVPNPANPFEQLFTGCFEIVTGSLAYSAPAGPTFAQLGLQYGIVSAEDYAFYLTLPPAGQDAFVQSLLDTFLTTLAYSPTGIDDPSIDATFAVGGPIATHHYGWTEFDVDPASKALTITTHGVDWYTPEEAAADPEAIIARPITVRQRIVLNPSGGGCLGDLNLDGTVNGVDLGEVFGAWGECSGSCAADLDGSGHVDAGDIAVALASWGDC